MLQDRTTVATEALFSAGDLLSCDPAAETIMHAFRRQPADVLKAIGNVLRGRETATEAAARSLTFDPSALLYNQFAIGRLRAAQEAGLRTTLTGGLPDNWCRQVAAHLGMNYAGESPSPPPAGADDVLAHAQPRVHLFDPARHHSPFFSALHAMRVHQWPKNALVFLPILLAHRVDEIALVIASVIAFFTIGFAASAIYVLNDLTDIATDRQHPSKRKRPFASGALPARAGLLLALFCVAAACCLATLLPASFAAALAAYLGLNLAYTAYLKRRLLVDVLALAGSYTLRILAGNAATGIELSFWLLAFSLFFFFSLALVKRYVEMDTLGAARKQEKRVMGRGYRYSDREMLSQMGVASAFSAILVLALYVERSSATGLYTRPGLIWLICPIVFYVVGRIWFLARRGEMRDDPVAFILHDWRSHLMGGVAASIMLAASL